MDAEYLKFVFYLKKISFSIKTIWEGEDTINDRRVTKVFGAVNEKIIGRRKQKIGRENWF